VQTLWRSIAGKQSGLPFTRSFHQSAGAFAKTRVYVPPCGKYITQARIGSLNYNVNQTVHAGDVVATLETPDTNIEVYGPVTGKIVQILVSRGDEVSIGDELFVIEDERPPTRKLIYTDFLPQRVDSVYEPFSMVIQRANEWASENGRELINIETLPSIKPGEVAIQTLRVWAWEDPK